jgi:hypothetical protein
MDFNGSFTLHRNVWLTAIKLRPTHAASLKIASFSRFSALSTNS